MKTKRINKKLSISKVTIANLNHRDMGNIQGGADTSSGATVTRNACCHGNTEFGTSCPETCNTIDITCSCDSNCNSYCFQTCGTC